MLSSCLSEWVLFHEECVLIISPLMYSILNALNVTVCYINSNNSTLSKVVQYNIYTHTHIHTYIIVVELGETINKLGISVYSGIEMWGKLSWTVNICV